MIPSSREVPLWSARKFPTQSFRYWESPWPWEFPQLVIPGVSYALKYLFYQGCIRQNLSGWVINFQQYMMRLFYLSPTANSTKRQEVINQYSASLQQLWICSFGKEHVKLNTTIPRILSRIMAEYDKFRKTNLYGNAKRGIPPKNICKINKEWLKYCEEHATELTRIQEKKGPPSKAKSSTSSDKPTEVVNESGLLDIGLNTKGLTGAEQMFYAKGFIIVCDLSGSQFVIFGKISKFSDFGRFLIHFWPFFDYFLTNIESWGF